MKKILDAIVRGLKKAKHALYHVDKNTPNARYLIVLGVIKIKITNRKREALYGYLFISAWLIGFIWLTLFPLIRSLIFSLSDVKISGDKGIESSFIGFANYTRMIKELDFLEEVLAFLTEVAIYLPIILIISIIIAILLNRKMKLRGFFRSIFFLPVIIASGPVMATLMGTSTSEGILALSDQQGMLATLSSSLPPFFANFMVKLFSELVTILWFSGVQIILFLAGLQKINTEVYEAAEIDGSSPWEMFWKITLPSLKSIILVSSIYTIVMLSTFSNNGVLAKISNARNNDIGYASALSWVYFIVVALLLGIITLILVYEKKTKEVVMHRSVKR